ncbi:MAG: hypothetical protein J0L97_10980, partial [Alphaproteobacteria bacterium]|nr:hypothetical protein [Alphaproteobacteria bacterium]
MTRPLAGFTHRDVVLDLTEMPEWRQMQTAMARIYGANGPIWFDAVDGEAKVRSAALRDTIVEGLRERAEQALPELASRKEWITTGTYPMVRAV